MKTITLMQHGHEIPVKVLVKNVKQFYQLTYKTGEVVTVIEFIDGTENHFLNDIKDVERLINN